MHCAVELRRAKRYRLSAPALFVWAGQDGKPQNGQGVTRDINTSGVYVLTDALPPVGARIQIEIVLPKLAGTSPGMRLTGEGVVLRREGESAKIAGATERGFATSAQFYPETTDAALTQLRFSWQVM